MCKIYSSTRMSSVSSSYASAPKRQYIASMTFNTNIFQYSTYLDSFLITRGRLVIHPSATLSNCAPRAILRENGKKLHGLTHPDLNDPTTGLPYTQLVGVYDVVSGINGFINPNAPYFAVLSTDKSYQDDTAAYQVDASKNTPNSNWANTYSSQGQQILGPPVNTRGDISSEGYITGGQVHAENLFHTSGYIVSGPESLILNPVNPITGFAVTYGAGTMLANSNITTLANLYASNGTVLGSNLVALSNIYASNGMVVGSNLVALSNIYASNGTVFGSNLVALSNMTLNTGDLTVTQGRLILNSNNSGIADLTNGSNEGTYRKITVTTAASRPTSQVFLTFAGFSGTTGFLSSEDITTGSFRIVSTDSNDRGVVRWMVIN